MPAVFLNRKRHIRADLIQYRVQLFRKRKTVFILRAAKNPNCNIFLFNRPYQFVRMLLQHRNPRALQHQHIAARRRKGNRTKKHIASGRKSATHDFSIPLVLHSFHRVCHRQIRSFVIAPSIGSVSVRLAALDRLDLPAVFSSQYRLPVRPRGFRVLCVPMNRQKQILRRLFHPGKTCFRAGSSLCIARVRNSFQRKKLLLVFQQSKVVILQHFRAIPPPAI